MKRQNSNDKFPSKMKEYLLKSDKQIASVEILIQQSQVNHPQSPSATDHGIADASSGFIIDDFSDAISKQPSTMEKILL